MVAPPVDDSGVADAAQIVGPTLTRPLVEHGYYVFPSSVVSPVLSRLKIDAQNPAAIARLDGVFGAEAILLTRIKAFRRAQGEHQVEVALQLLEVKSGRVLWEGSGAASGDGEGVDPMRALAEAANQGAMAQLPRGR